MLSYRVIGENDFWEIISLLKAGFVPVSIIIGFLFINSVTVEPSIPVLQIVLTVFLGLLSLALVTVVVAMSVLLARIPSSVVGISCEDPECVHCPAAVFYGTWVWLGFKYLDVVKLVVVLVVTFRK